MEDPYAGLQKSNLQFQSTKILLAWHTTDEWKKVQSLSDKVLGAGVELIINMRNAKLASRKWSRK